jgi:hypothetical protein
VCGQPVDPNVDILLTVGGKSLFPVHQGACRQSVRNGVVAVRDIVETRYPAVRVARTIFSEIMKALNS